MRKNPIVALLLTIALLFAVVAPVMAVTSTEYLTSQLQIFHTTNRMSSNDIYGVYVDISQITNNTVTATVYQTDAQQATLTTYTNIEAQPIAGANSAKDKLSRFFFYFRNNNRDHPMALWGGAPDDTVMGYVYGERKAEIISAYVAGIPECLAQDRLYDSGDSGSSGSTTKTTEAKPAENPDAWAGKYLATTFEIGATTYSVLSSTNEDASETAKPEIKTMDVAPYVKNDRTYVPVRYLAYSLGVEEGSVTWDGNARKVSISKDDTDIALIVGSPIMYVNGQSTNMDVSPEITQDRTFLPARWVAEALGAEVLWDDATQQTTIKIPVEKPGN
jgi:hypothetical protein